MNKAKIGIIGATGYVGVELVRALSGHEGVHLTTLVSQSYVGKKFSDVYPQFRSICDIVLSSLDVSLMKDTCDLVITALPHGVSSKSSLNFSRRAESGLAVIFVTAKFMSTKKPTGSSIRALSSGLRHPELYREVLCSTGQ